MSPPTSLQGKYELRQRDLLHDEKIVSKYQSPVSVLQGKQSEQESPQTALCSEVRNDNLPHHLKHHLWPDN